LSIFDRFTVYFDSTAGFLSLSGFRGATSKRFGNSGKASLLSDPPKPLNTKFLLLQTVVLVVNLDDWKMENFGFVTSEVATWFVVDWATTLPLLTAAEPFNANNGDNPTLLDLMFKYGEVASMIF
jgi:hypothetical protein